MAQKRKRKRTQKPSEDAEKVPKSFVVKFGNVSTVISELVRDFRKVMEPHTASRLKERKSNKLRDFLMVSGQYGVSHFILFSQSMVGTNMKIGTAPRGPTLTFRVKQYSLAKDCRALQKNPKAPGSELNTSPLMILNNFGNEDNKIQFKLMKTVFQSLFPSINPNKMHLADARRVVLLNYNDDTDTIDFRHYLITVNVVGVSKGIKKLLNDDLKVKETFGSNAANKLSDMKDIGEFILNEDYASDSEVEDNGESKVTLPQNYVGRGNLKSEQRAIKLVEIGPRLELELVKIEDGLCEGDVMYHKYIHKTPEEVEQIKLKKQKMLTEKARRKQEQQENVDKKKLLKEKNKKSKSVSFESQKEDSEQELDPNEDSGVIHEINKSEITSKEISSDSEEDLDIEELKNELDQEVDDDSDSNYENESKSSRPSSDRFKGNFSKGKSSNKSFSRSNKFGDKKNSGFDNKIKSKFDPKGRGNSKFGDRNSHKNKSFQKNSKPQFKKFKGKR
ncbi:Suppressor of SWI4 1-like protein [Smittium mucronatum]|uniref:Suppressor of SWI4 1-like protein n=1 Tax=Smittium mucronatum TaxID=133383 RepID=A0A1R0GRS7_9FUNG|nr:Suppressor of SWI4 1-like protein [Smittium mucronatum]